MAVLMEFIAFGTRLQALWIMFNCQKRFSLWSEDKILFRQLRFSLFSSARYFDIGLCLRRFLSEDF